MSDSESAANTKQAEAAYDHQIDRETLDSPTTLDSKDVHTPPKALKGITLTAIVTLSQILVVRMFIEGVFVITEMKHLVCHAIKCSSRVTSYWCRPQHPGRPAAMAHIRVFIELCA